MDYGSCAASAVKHVDVTLLACGLQKHKISLGACLIAGMGRGIQENSVLTGHEVLSKN